MRLIDNEATGQNIKRMCRDKGITVKDIVDALCLGSSQSVYKWFSDKSTSIPSLDHLVMLSELLECTVDELLVVLEI